MARPKKEHQETELTHSVEDIAAMEQKLAEAKRSVKYNFQKQSQKLHSLYKLQPAKFKKNVSYTSTPEWVDVEHVHFFHSISSTGEKQTRSVNIGGHFHELIEVTPATADEPAVYRCSGPLKEVRQKNAAGQWEIVTVPATAIDHHTHDVTYLHSEIWSPQPLNQEFLKFQQQMASKIVKSDQFVEG